MKRDDILKQSKKEILINVFTVTAIRITVLVLPVFWGYVINRITEGNFENAYFYVFLCLITIILYWASEYVNQIAFYKLYNKIYLNLTKNAINGISRNSLFSLSRFSLSEYLNILGSDVDIIASYYTNLVARIVRIVENLVIYYYFYKVNFYMFLIVIVISAIGMLLFALARKKTERNNLERKADLDQKTAYNHEFFTGIRDIKSYNLFGKISTRLFNGTETYLNSNAKYNINFNGDKFFIICFIEIVKYFLMFYGVYLIGIGKMDIGVLTIIYNYYAKIVDNFSIISTLNVEKCNLKVSRARYDKIFEHISNNDNAVVKNRTFVGNIEFYNVLYGYRNDPTLKDVSFKIKENSITSIVGRDDSGYKGVYELLLKMNRQHEGAIMIDDIDIKDIQNATYYNTVSLINSDPFFFNLSIKENLTLINRDFEEITSLCKSLNIYDEIKALPKGFDNTINDSVSKELRLMLSITRGLLKKTKIILIADVVFELNQKDKNAVIKHLKALSKDHTIVVLGRELDLCSISDEIIVFNQNEIAEIGNHEELIKKEGFYYNNFYNYGNDK